jgi:hypothetical protein
MQTGQETQQQCPPCQTTTVDIKKEEKETENKRRRRMPHMSTKSNTPTEVTHAKQIFGTPGVFPKVIDMVQNNI